MIQFLRRVVKLNNSFNRTESVGGKALAGCS